MAKAALQAVGFIYLHAKGIDMFLDGPNAKARDKVHVIFAGEKVCPDDPEPVPSIDKRERIKDMNAITLEALVKMKLISYRRKDQVHLLDMLSVGLIDATWPAKYSPVCGIGCRL